MCPLPAAARLRVIDSRHGWTATRPRTSKMNMESVSVRGCAWYVLHRAEARCHLGAALAHAPLDPKHHALFPEDREGLVDRGADGVAGDRHAQRLRYRADLHALARGE